MQNGSTHVRRVVNSGQTVEEGGKREDWEVTRECVVNVVCIFFLGLSFSVRRMSSHFAKYNLHYLEALICVNKS